MTDRAAVLRDITERFSEDIQRLDDVSHKRVYIDIETGALVKMALCLFNQVGARFNIASGVDCRSHIEILYHFTVEDINLMVSLRVRLDREKPVVDSLTPYMKAADWIEREMNELLGIEFTGHPDMRRLLLADFWPKGVYPLRADYEEWDDSAVRDRGV